MNSLDKTLFFNPWTLALPLLDLPEARRSLSLQARTQIRTLSLPNVYYNFKTKKLQLEEVVFTPKDKFGEYFLKYSSLFNLLESLKADNSRLRQMEVVMWINTYVQLPEIAAIIRTNSFNNFLKTGEVIYD